MNIVLIGFMGAGKTTVGRLLAKELKRKFYDCDNLIVQKMELPIEEIFKVYGEIKFREVESEILSRLLKMDGVIIATGGGVITRYRNVEMIKKRGFVIYLFADALILYERLKKDRTKRPLLSNENYFYDMMKLILMRESIYKKVADVIVDTSSKSPQKVSSEIITKLREKKII